MTALIDSEQRPAPSVLFIAGMHRSGTTLAARLLGEIEGFFCAGELNSLWESESCGCGRPVDECPVWSAVLNRAFVHTRPADRSEIFALQAHIRSRPVGLLKLIRAARNPAVDHPVRRYGEILRSVLLAISEVTGADVIVDSTKTPSYAYVTAKLTGLPVSILHLVRDPRAVANSFIKSPGNEVQYMGRLAPLVSSGRWLAWNVMVETLGSTAVKGHYRRMRYEDMVRAPADAMVSARELVGATDRALPDFLASDEANFGPSHTVAGNLPRFRVGPTTIHRDEDWRPRLKPIPRTLATLPALPLLTRYRYRLVTPRHTTR